MTAETKQPLASVSHISLMHRPYGPRVHMDEAGGGSATPESFASPMEAFQFARQKRNDAPAADAGSNSGDDAGDAGDDAGTNSADRGAEHGDDGETELSDEGNGAPDEDQAHAGDEDHDAEADALPPVERPKSWSKDDQAEWESLPRSLQEKIAAREDTREKAIRKAQNDAASASKGLTAKEQAAEQARQNYEARAREAHAILIREQQAQFSDIKTMDDVNALTNPNSGKYDPLRYVQWLAHQQDLQVTAQAVKDADQRAAQKKADEWKTFRGDQDAKAAEYITDLRDPEKAPKVMKAAVEHLQAIGFAPEELVGFDKGEKLSLFDHRIQRLIFDGLRYAQVQKAAQAAKKTPVPPVQRPGARQPTGNSSGEKLTALNNRLSSTGSIKDAAKLLAARRNARR